MPSSFAGFLALALFLCGSAALAPARAGQIWAVAVPGTSDPWLAGMPDGAGASLGDAVPGQSPVLVGFTPHDNMYFVFRAWEAVNNGPGLPFAGPDGADFITHQTGAENGISGVNAPINSVVGVFLGPDQPDSGPAPEALDFAPGGTVPDGIDYRWLEPAVRQVFFIGNGRMGDDGEQRVYVPAGATRLYLGTMDGAEWSNNEGAFGVTVYSIYSIEQPEPATLTLLGIGGLGLAGCGWWRRGRAARG